MKKNLLLALLFGYSFSMFAQSVFENPEIQYEILMEEFWSSADNDNVTLDDLTLKWNITTVPGNHIFERCETWTGNAPCSKLNDPFDPNYHLNVDNADILEYMVLNYEGWEDDGGDPCTYDSGDDFYIAANPPLRNNGFIAGMGETQGRWETKNASIGTEFVFFQSLIFDLRYRIAWRHVHGETINDPLRFGFLNHSANVATGGTNRFSVEEATNPNLAWKNDGGQNSADTYYQFSLNHYSRVIISTDNAQRTFDTYLTLYNANQVEITHNDDGGVLGDGYAAVIDIVLAPGTYYINAEASDLALISQETGEYLLNIEVLLPNDEPCGAINLPVNGMPQTGFSNVVATVSNNEPGTPLAGDCFGNTTWCNSETGEQLRHSVWFSFQAPASGAVEISTCGLANFDTQIALYGADGCNNLPSYALYAANDDGVDCADYTSVMTRNNLIPGATYYILVDGFEDKVGNIGLKITSLQNSAVQNLVATPDVLSVSPNPTSGPLHLQFKGSDPINSLRLTDMGGKTLMTDLSKASDQEIDLDLSGLPNGVYLLQVQTGEKVFTQKIVVQR